MVTTNETYREVFVLKVRCCILEAELTLYLLISYPVGIPEVSTVLANVTSMRGGIVATLGVIGSQLPYSFVYVIYWIVQIMLLSLAIETGVALAVNSYFKTNGTPQMLNQNQWLP